MLTTGLTLGFLAWLSLLMTFRHLPSKVRDWLLRHPLLSDILASLITLFVLGGISQSLASIIGTVFTAVLVEISLLGYGYFRPTRNFNEQ